MLSNVSIKLLALHNRKVLRILEWRTSNHVYCLTSNNPSLYEYDVTFDAISSHLGLKVLNH